MSKKTIYQITVSISVLALVFLIYFFFFRGSSEIGRLDEDRIRNPFGTFFPTDNTGLLPNETGLTPSPFEPRINKLTQITNIPVAGFNLYTKENNAKPEEAEEKNIVRFAERATGHIYENTLGEQINTRISNTTLPKIHKAKFFNNTNSVIYQFLDENNNNLIKSYFANINLATSTNEENSVIQEGRLIGYFLPDNINQIDISKNDIFLRFISNSGDRNTNSITSISTINAINNPRIVLNSQISQFLVEWIDNRYVLMTTKPSYLAPGYVYIMDTNNGDLQKIIGPFFGLTAKVSPDRKKVFYSYLENRKINTHLMSLETKEFFTINLATLPDKCVWNSNSTAIYCGVPNNTNGDFPDVWYMGIHSFNDNLVSIDSTSGSSEFLMRGGSEGNTLLDIINIQISSDNDYLVFQNKKDLSLWLYDLK